MVGGTFTNESGPRLSVDELLGRAQHKKRRRADDERWYASFVVQPSGGRRQLDSFLEAMPLSELSECFRPSRHEREAVVQGEAVWVFFGRCGGDEPVAGRAEHVDAVSSTTARGTCSV